MPTALMLTEDALPKYNEAQDDTQRIKEIYNYLFMLVEQLRYSLANLGVQNFNETELNNISDSISDPLEEDIGVVTKRITDAEGNISELTMTSSALVSRISDAEGNINQLTVTSEALVNRIGDAEGNINQLSLTAQSLSSRISDAEGNISTISQTVNGLSFSVTNGSSSSIIRLMSGSIQLSSASISFSGMVTFSDLSTSGRTTINGGNITTGTIEAIDISGCTITGSEFKSVLTSSGYNSGTLSFYYQTESYLAGGIVLDDTGSGGIYESRYRMFLYTNNVRGVAFGLKLQSAGSTSIEANQGVYIYGSSYITLDSGGDVTINNPVLIDSSGGTWVFNSQGIFRDGYLLVDTTQGG